MEYSRSQIRDIIGWDTATWSKALRVWDEVIPGRANALAALELGAGRGGLSIYLAVHGYRVICSDIRSPESEARGLHEKHSVAERVSYLAIDATAIDLPDHSVDAIAFKSLLAVLGKYDGKASQDKAMQEFFRVLKPGGLLLFAENLAATRLHMFLRRRFVKWGSYCRYPSLAEFEDYLARYSRFRLEATGFLATFGRSESQRSFLHFVDTVIDPFIPRSHHYLAVGWAQK